MKAIAIFLSLICVAPAWGAVAFDASSSATEAGQDNAVQVTHTATGSNRLVVCAVHWQPATDTVSSVTYNGVGMTQSAVGVITTNSYRVDLYSLVAPATGAQTVLATMSGTNSNKAITCMSFTGAHQVTPLGTGASFSGTSDPMTASITVPANGMGVMFCTNNENGGTFTPGGSQTEPFADFSDTDGNFQAMASYTSTSGGVSMTFTNGTGNYGACIAYPISEAAAASSRRPISPMVFQ